MVDSVGPIYDCVGRSVKWDFLEIRFRAGPAEWSKVLETSAGGRISFAGFARGVFGSKRDLRVARPVHMRRGLQTQWTAANAMY